MNTKITSAVIIFSLLLMACGGKEEKKKEGFSIERAKTTTEKSAEEPADTGTPASQRVQLDNKGVGPIDVR